MTVWPWPRTVRAIALAVALLLWLSLGPWGFAVAVPLLVVSWVLIDWLSARRMTAEGVRRRDAGDRRWTHCANCGLVEFPAHCHADAHPWGLRDQPCHPAWREEG